MNFELRSAVTDILILGAGASVEYGLPVWKHLGELIKQKIQADHSDAYGYKAEILEWIDKIGDDKAHKTLDQCISVEASSDAYPSGDQVEDQIFRIVKDIFNEKYKAGAGGWLRTFNDSILHADSSLEDKFAIINYNYDRTVEDLLLDYSYLHNKLRRNNFRVRLAELNAVSIPVLYPHGNLYSKAELKPTKHTERFIETMKTHDISQVNAVSCYESDVHQVSKMNRIGHLNLYILGLGAGLAINLNNLLIHNPIGQIHVTVRDEAMREKVINYLSAHFKIPAPEIQTYSSCDELIEKCFMDQ